MGGYVIHAIGRGGGWEPDHETGSAVGRTVHGDRAAVGVDELLDHGQADSASGHGPARSRRGRSDPRPECCSSSGMPGPVSSTSSTASDPSLATRSDTVPARRRELGRVGQQVGDDLVQAVGIADDQVGGRSCWSRYAGRPEAGGQRIGGLGRRPDRQVQEAALEVQSGGLRRRQGLQVLDHPTQPDRFVVQRDQGLGRRRR